VLEEGKAGPGRHFPPCHPTFSSEWCHSAQHPRQHGASPPNILVSVVPFHPTSSPADVMLAEGKVGPQQVGAISPSSIDSMEPVRPTSTTVWSQSTQHPEQLHPKSSTPTRCLRWSRRVASYLGNEHHMMLCNSINEVSRERRDGSACIMETPGFRLSPVMTWRAMCVCVPGVRLRRCRSSALAGPDQCLPRH